MLLMSLTGATAMGIALRRGRYLDQRDRSVRVVLVSESAARNIWPGEDAVGKVIVNDPRSDRVTVIGSEQPPR